LGIKQPAEVGAQGFLLWRGLGAFVWALAWFFCFWLFGVGSFWKGKELLKEKELLKRNC
jgi:hypothetical protein